VAGIPGDYGGFTRFGRVQGFVSEQQAVMRVPLYPAMTADAVFIQDRLDLGAEVDGLVPASDTHQKEKRYKSGPANVCHVSKLQDRNTIRN
jgi:hypothetical protein